MSLWKNYYLAQNLKDALKALEEMPPPVRIVAGGTDLLLDLQQGRVEAVQSLVDISRAPELCVLETRQKSLFVGAAVPLSEVAAAMLVKDHAQALAEACSLIGGPQVRNTATLGGNVAHALPAADGSIALLALDAQAEVAWLDDSRQTLGSRMVPLGNLYLGPGKSALNQGHEMLVGFQLPLQRPGQASAFRRIMRPQGVALPVLNMACWLKRQGEHIVDLRIALGPSGRIPYHALEVEAVLRGAVFNDANRHSAGQVLLKSAHFRTSPRRASAEYRQLLAVALLDEVLLAAWERSNALFVE